MSAGHGERLGRDPLFFLSIFKVLQEAPSYIPQEALYGGLTCVAREDFDLGEVA